ncbi:MAG: hypothetical protein DRR08_19775 [Candidatus Parabeggiatoa sp. nov. 2]|nr:MAG: hypothetical protein DRR08_19775 [Gammaproteobacteria bacterium]
MSTTKIFRQGISTLLNSSIIEILSDMPGVNKALDLLQENFTFTADEMAKNFQDGYGYALAAISSGLATPKNQQGFWKTLFQSNVNRELVTRIERDYLRPFAKQQGLTAAQLQTFRQTAAQQCQKVAKLTLFQGDNVVFSEAELATFVTSNGASSMTDLVLEHIQADLDDRVVALLRYKELLGNAVLFFLHEQLRKDERFNNTLAALQREGLMVDVREIKQIVQTTEAKLNQAVAAKKFGDVAQLGQQLEQLQQVESVTQTHYAQFLEFSQRFADWAPLVNVQLEQVLTATEQMQEQLGGIKSDTKQIKGDTEEILALLQQLMARAGLSAQIKARDEFAPHSSTSLQQIQEAVAKLKGLPTAAQYNQLAIKAGSVLFSTGNPKHMAEAEALLVQARDSTQVPAEKALACFNLFQIRLRRQAYDEALADLQTAITIDRNYAWHDVGKYPMIRILGAGGMGCVFLCHDQWDEGNKVVVKCFWEGRKGSRKAVFGEAMIMRKIASAYVPTPLDCGYVDAIRQERPFFVTEYLEGALDGETWLKKHGKLDVATGLAVGLQIAKGLQVAHQQGVYHLDLKPANLLFKQTESGLMVKIIDFGQARVATSLRQEALSRRSVGGMTQLGQALFFGTLYYAPPEQRGETQYGKPSAKSDLYAFAATLYRLMTGEMPDTLNPHYLADAPSALFELLCDCKKNDPAQRPDSAQLVKRLEDILAKLEQIPHNLPFSNGKRKAQEEALKAVSDKRLSFWNPFAFQRRFQPRLDWQPAKTIEIDFNKQPCAILVGTVIVRNDGKVPWFGRLLRNKDYPDYQVKFSLNYRHEQLINGGFLLSDEGEEVPLVPLGFREVGEETALTRNMKLRVSHETPIYIFLATDVITDFQAHQTVSGPRTVTFGGPEKDFHLSVEMWRAKKPVAAQEIDFELELVPEEPQPPLVTYQARAETLYFGKGKSLSSGTFRFESQAQHQFAKPFKGRFNILSYKNNLPLLNNPVTLAEGEEVVVLPAPESQSKKRENNRVESKVLVFCDGEIISNPEPRQDYSFNLTGKFAHEDSEPGPHTFTLHRDPTRAYIALEIVQFKKTYSLYWQPKAEKASEKAEKAENAFEKSPRFRLRLEGREEAEGHSLDNGILNLDHNLVKFDKGTLAVTIFEIQLGNTGNSGQGWVKLHLTMELKFQPQVRRAIKLYQGYQIKNSLHLITKDYQGEFTGARTITVKEGEPVEKLVVQIFAGQIIQDIVGGRIDTNSGSINAYLDIEIQDDDGQKRSHALSIVAPIGLEKLPHPNWLCIDFGTSAIVAAIGTQDKLYILPLQKLVKEHDPALNLEDYDPNNTERGTDFLPSHIVCDADLRRSETQDDKIRKGYPTYQPASLKPGDPDFIGLPATTPRIREYPGRVIFSLKSLLAQPSETISLQEEVKFYQLDNLGNVVTETDEDGNHKPVEIVRPQLPLKYLLESVFAALAEGYITALEVFEKGGQLILSHPNTFTAFHKNRLHDIAWKALNQRLGIALKERIQLISESDAVAYHYCRQRMLEARHRGETERLLEKRRLNNRWERLLVYDFGAGTLDLSLVHIRWNQEGTYPEQWQVENRLSVPIAGNHIDSLLARLIDGLLRDESVLNPEVFEYRYPVVDNQLKGSQEVERNNHRDAVYRLWQNIRDVKHSADWQEGKPFRVLVGSKGAGEVVRYKENAFLYSLETAPEVRSESQERSEVEKPVLETDGDQIYLNIPAATVHNYPPLQAFIEFVTDTVVNELLDCAGIAAQNVNTVVISGRGALWPGLRERVWDKFPEHCEKPKLDKQQVKNAVVSGAIAWQELKIKAIEPKIKPRLAILREGDQSLVPEEDWGQGPIDLRASSTFSLVQVSHRHPDSKDFNSLRCHFYIKLARYRRDLKWKGDPRLFVRKKESNNQTIVRLENAGGHGYDFKALGSNSPLSSVAPWPIGQVVLSENLYG